MSDLPQSLSETKDLHVSLPDAIPRGDDLARYDGVMHGLLATTLEQMADAWRAGQGTAAEDYLAAQPELTADPEAAVRIIYEEFCLREEVCQKVPSLEFLDRFPQYREKLEVVLECHRLLHDAESSSFPRAGEQIGELKLLCELGRGALGRVFLATQPSLCDRPLAVKITTRMGQEHLSLARLQHTNIAPLYLVQDFPERHLRALCMPYLGGATWSAVLKALKETAPDSRSGQAIVQFLAEERNRHPVSFTSSTPAIGFLGRSTYCEAVCWIGSCLADALHYAHQRGLVHLDIKPSNVLLAGDGQPMLLDFHLAREIQELRSNASLWLGGTPGYMSPEQTAATEALRRGTLDTRQIDGRCDIYSLGVLIYESLAGELPSAIATVARTKLRQNNPSIDQGLEDIVFKCLATSKEERYVDAGQLADDLRCHLANLPLRGVANRSLRERWQKWRRRKPHAMPILAAAAAAILIIFTVAGLFYRDRVRSGEAALAQSQRELESKQFASAIDHAQSALWGLRFFPWKADLTGRLKSQISAAQRAKAVVSLHELVQQLRFLENEPLNRDTLAEIAAGCDKVWQARASFATTLAHEDEKVERPLSADQLRNDLLDLAILSARLNFGLTSPSEEVERRRQAIQRLGQAEEMCGASPILDLEIRDYKTGAARVGDIVGIQPIPQAKTSWEHDAIGRWLMRHRSIDEADRQFQAAIEMEPDDFWANFQEALCKYELSQFGPALTYATVCVALAPGRAECYCNRALCCEALDQNEQAKADLDRAIEMNPKFAAALLARGALYVRLKQYQEAAGDLDSALSLGAKPSDVYFQFARLQFDQHDQTKAAQWLEKSLAADPTNADSLALKRQLSRD